MSRDTEACICVLIGFVIGLLVATIIFVKVLWMKIDKIKFDTLVFHIQGAENHIEQAKKIISQIYDEMW